MKWKPYPEYKESGVEWLGEVPEHWKTVEIKWLSPVLRGASPRPIEDPKYFDDDGEYAWVRISDVTAAGPYLRETTQRLSALGSSLSVKLQPGQLFLSIAATVGQPCVTTIRACIHDGFVYFPKLRENPKLFFYVFSGGEAFRGLGKLGTQLNLNTDTVGSIRIGLPPPAEAEAITGFLDRETAKIDTLISKQEHLIELLQEKRQALISHAVTKGLNPDAPMKPSGVEWLGEVPAHWEVKPLKHIVPAVTVGIVVTPAKYYVDDGVPCLRSLNISGKSIDEADLVFISQESNELLRKSQIRSGDIVVVRTGQTGTAAVVPPELDGANCIDLLIVRRSKSIASEYLWHFLNSEQTTAQIAAVSEGAIQSHYNTSTLCQLVVTVPPLEEQSKILEFLRKRTDAIDKLVNHASVSIALMREHRTALISAAVTGKIDVRNLHLTLPLDELPDA